MPPNYFEATWARLEASLGRIFNVQSAASPATENLSLEELYKSVENLCLNGFAERLHGEKLDIFLRDYVTSVLLPQIANARRQHAGSAEAWLHFLNSEFRQFCRQMMVTRSVFMFLDRTYLLLHSELMTLWEYGLVLFREHLMMHDAIRELSCQSFLEQLERHRY